MSANLDPCCTHCKTPSGVCATKRACDHHQARRRASLDGRPPYRDPTGDAAASHADSAALERELGYQYGRTSGAHLR